MHFLKELLGGLPQKVDEKSGAILITQDVSKSIVLLSPRALEPLSLMSLQQSVGQATCRPLGFLLILGRIVACLQRIIPYVMEETIVQMRSGLGNFKPAPMVDSGEPLTVKLTSPLLMALLPLQRSRFKARMLTDYFEWCRRGTTAATETF